MPIVTYLDQVADGFGDGLHGSLQIRHGVSILGLFVQYHQPGDLNGADMDIRCQAQVDGSSIARQDTWPSHTRTILSIII